jgi:hypothetical protein
MAAFPSRLIRPHPSALSGIVVLVVVRKFDRAFLQGAFQVFGSAGSARCQLEQSLEIGALSQRRDVLLGTELSRAIVTILDGVSEHLSNRLRVILSDLLTRATRRGGSVLE